MTDKNQSSAEGDDMLEPLIYAAIMHNGTPKTVADFERAAAGVADMLKRRAQPQPKGMPEPLTASELLNLFGGRTVVSITEAVQLTERAHGIGNHTIGGPNFKSPRAAQALAETKATEADHQNAMQPCICNPRTFCHSREACQAADAAVPAPAPGAELPRLPKVGPIGYASVVDVEAYAPWLKIGPHLPGVRDVALWTTDQMHAYARTAIAAANPSKGLSTPWGDADDSGEVPL